MSVVFVSWVMLLLTVLCLGYAYESRTESQATDLLTKEIQLAAWCHSGLDVVLQEISSQTNPDRPWTPARTTIGRIPVDMGKGFFVAGHWSWDRAGKVWCAGPRDEQSLLPPNLFSSNILKQLPGMTTQGADRILEAYAQSSNEVMPPFESIPGLDQQSLQAAYQYLARFGTGLNLNTAEATVLEAIGLNASTVERLVKYRSGNDGILGTRDDHLFRELNTNSLWTRRGGFNHDEVTLLAFLGSEGLLRVTPEYLTIVVRGHFHDQAPVYELSTITKLTDKGTSHIVDATEGFSY